MNVVEAGKLLALASGFDNRTVTVEIAQLWHEVLEFVNYEDAQEALKEHFKTSGEYLMPFHIVQGSMRARDRRERLERISRPALPRPLITLDKAKFDRDVKAAIEAERVRKASEVSA